MRIERRMIMQETEPKNLIRNFGRTFVIFALFIVAVFGLWFVSRIYLFISCKVPAQLRPVSHIRAMRGHAGTR